MFTTFRNYNRIAVVAIVLGLVAPSAQAGMYRRVPPTPLMVRDVWTADTLTCFDVAADGRFIGLVGRSIRLYASNGTLVRTIGTVPDYDNGTEYASFCRLTPDEDEVWVGFTVSGNVDDRIYNVDANAQDAVASHQATLAGNYDLEFTRVNTDWKPFVSGTNSTTWGDLNKVWLLDTSGANVHTEIVNVGGYSAGIAFDADGDLFALGNVAQKLYRFTAADVLAVVAGGASLTADNADFATDMALSGSDVTVDAAGSVFFNGNAGDWSGKSQVCLLRPEYAGTFKYDNIAVGDGTFGNWSTFLATSGTGDVLSGEGALYVGDFYAWQTLTEMVVPEPATLGLMLAGLAVAGLVRRRMK